MIANASTFDELLARESRLVERTALRLVRFCDDLDDARSVAMVALWRAWRSFSDQCQWGAFAGNRIWCESIDELRRRSRYGRITKVRMMTMRFSDYTKQSDHHDDASGYDPIDSRSCESIEAVENADELAAVLRVLDSRQVTVARMTADDATQDAIAQAIGCKRSNVSLIRRDMRRRAEMVSR